VPFIQTDIPDVTIFEPRVFEDDRGYFFESYNQKSFADAGIDANFVQDNQSKSEYGTIRGLHFQTGDFAQAKLVRAIEGTVLDVAVDLRPHSPTYGQHVCVELSDKNKQQLYVPRGFAHGFSVLSDTAIFAYKCDNFYSPDHEAGIIYNDAELSIDWQIDGDSALLSPKDKKLKTWNEYKDAPCF
jgi:dTDP-4-dehydrorhamnose 3,5-epimerase